MALRKLCTELRDHQGDIHELVLGQDRCEGWSGSMFHESLLCNDCICACSQAFALIRVYYLPLFDVLALNDSVDTSIDRLVGSLMQCCKETDPMV